MIHEVVGGVGLVLRSGHEEGGGCAEGDDGVGGAEGEGEDRGRVVACKRDNGAGWREAVAVDEVG